MKSVPRATYLAKLDLPGRDWYRCNAERDTPADSPADNIINTELNLCLSPVHRWEDSQFLRAPITKACRRGVLTVHCYLAAAFASKTTYESNKTESMSGYKIQLHSVASCREWKKMWSLGESKIKETIKAPIIAWVQYLRHWSVLIPLNNWTNLSHCSSYKWKMFFFSQLWCLKLTNAPIIYI